MKLTELRLFLAKLGISPKKSLSQNFLIDQNILEKVIALAAIQPHERVLEIGPGPGIITKKLLEVGADVTAVELDKTFAKDLYSLPMTLIEGDVLKVPLPRFDKVVSNLPYHITAPILGRLLPLGFKTMILFVQEEVARRMVAQKDSRDYGAFSLFVQFYSEPCYAFKVPRNCFYPRPKVDSAVVLLTKKRAPEVDAEKFFQFVQTTFQGRRKKVATTWKKKYGLIVDTDARPQNLSLEDFLYYFYVLSNNLFA